MVMRETLDGFQGGLQIGGRMITNFRYADDIILLATSEAELQELVDHLDRVSRKYSLLINVDKTKVMVSNGIACLHTHSEWTTGAGGYVPVPWVSDYRRWWVYDGILYQVKQRAGDLGITAENMEKSQHTDFNEDTTNESASVVCGSIRLWKLDSQKNEETRLDAFEMKGLRKILRVLWTAKKTNECVLNLYMYQCIDIHWRLFLWVGTFMDDE